MKMKNLKILIPLLISQTEKNFEIVFVDSGSNDGTIDTISSYLGSI